MFNIINLFILINKLFYQKYLYLLLIIYYLFKLIFSQTTNITNKSIMEINIASNHLDQLTKSIR
jgi:hypothetical protein